VKVLLDTCVISELRKPGGGDPRVASALSGKRDGTFFLSAVSVGEMVRGIALLEEGNKKRDLGAWLNKLEQELSGSILQVDVETARLWGTISATRQRKGRPLAAADGLIAATALRHGLAVMTRNVSDFEGTGVTLVNPWTA
jgi:predicted nucleic acid-binding protein